MPEPKEGETEKQFVSRCIPIVMEDGTAEDNEQAAAVCHSMWGKSRGGKSDETIITFGGAVKALGDGKLGGYLVRFTAPNEPDLQLDYFDASSQFGEAKASPVYYNHGLDPMLGLRQLADGELELKDAGVWIEAQLALRDEYEQAIYALAEKGKLGWSSGTAPHLVEREEKEGAYHVLRWPLGLDASLTPTPADPGNRAMPLKAWAETNIGNLKALTEDGIIEMPSGSATDGDEVKAQDIVEENAPRNADNVEGESMSEEKIEATVEETPTVDVEAIAKAAAEEAVKAYRATLEDEPPINQAGFVSGVNDEADRKLEGGFKSAGEFFIAVMNAGSGGGVDQRLLPLNTPDGYDVGKAMGQTFVGSVSSAAMAAKGWRKATGLEEELPSAGGFLVGTDRQPGILARMYDVGQLLDALADDLNLSIRTDDAGSPCIVNTRKDPFPPSFQPFLLFFWWYAPYFQQRGLDCTTLEELGRELI